MSFACNVWAGVLPDRECRKLLEWVAGVAGVGDALRGERVEGWRGGAARPCDLVWAAELIRCRQDLLNDVGVPVVVGLRTIATALTWLHRERRHMSTGSFCDTGGRELTAEEVAFFMLCGALKSEWVAGAARLDGASATLTASLHALQDHAVLSGAGGTTSRRALPLQAADRRELSARADRFLLGSLVRCADAVRKS